MTKQAQNMRARRAALIDTCTHCLVSAKTLGFATCEPCRTYSRENARLKYTPRRAS